MYQLLLFNKPPIAVLLMMALTFSSHAQKDIIKNGIKINHLDKTNKKQGSWFFFDENDKILLSCRYKDDSIASPLTFFRDNDTAFIRFPETNGIETFIIFLNGEQIAGSYQQFPGDSSVVDFMGVYKKAGKDSFFLDTDSAIHYPKEATDDVKMWFNKKILPVYMFGNVSLRDYLYTRFRSSDYIFNKAVFVVFFINASGIAEKVDFPREKNNLSTEEETELSYHLMSFMQRWQPFFFRNKTTKYQVSYLWKSTLR